MIQSPSPNFSTTTKEKIGIQIHKTLGLMPSTLHWLQNPESQASAHYLIPKAGEAHQLVNLKDRAWTSGVISSPSKRGLTLMQRVGLGVKPGEYLIQFEVECLEHQIYNDHQYDLIVEICESFNFLVEDWNTLTHQDTASYKPHLDKERLVILQRLSGRRLIRLQIQLFTLQVKLLMKKLLTLGNG